MIIKDKEDKKIIIRIRKRKIRIRKIKIKIKQTESLSSFKNLIK
jgi:hypothetical protein